MSHGMCLACAKSTEALAFEQLGEFSQAQLDALPLGVIELDPRGIVTAYNKAEARYSGLSPDRVLGRHFFTGVAPCTQVASFAGRFDRMVQATAPVRERLDFIFAFDSGERLASITMNWDPGRERMTVLVDLHR